jgi:hypothetical protein
MREICLFGETKLLDSRFIMLKNVFLCLLALYHLTNAVQYRGNKSGEFFEMQMQVRREGQPIQRRQKSDDMGNLVLTLVADFVVLVTVYLVVRVLVRAARKRFGGK